jgi:hypothetical protein
MSWGKAFYGKRIFIIYRCANVGYHLENNVDSSFLLLVDFMKLFIPTQWEFAFIFDARKIFNSEDLKGAVGFPRDF